MNESLAIYIEARRQAECMIKADCKRLGVKAPHSPAEMKAAALAHLASHPELIAAARVRVGTWFAGKKTVGKAPKSKA